MPEITKNQVKHIRLLKQKKYRTECKEFVVEGEKNVGELIKSKFEIKAIFAIKDWENETERIETTWINKKQLSQISNLTTPNKVLAIAKTPDLNKENLNFDKGLTLMLDSINDPGNLGTIIRTADWFGVKNIICSPNSVNCFNPKVVQSTKGSIFNVSVFYLDLKSILEKSNLQTYGASLEGEELNEKLNLELPCILLMGSESHGISPELTPYLTKEISIKKVGKAESLNVAIATSILLNELTK